MYAIKYLDRKGNTSILPQRFTDPKEANIRIKELAEISAKRIHGGASRRPSGTGFSMPWSPNVYHGTGNSIVRFTDWQSDFEEYWRISVTE